MKLQKDQHGFSAVEAVLIIVVIAILGFAGWFVWHKQKTTDTSKLDSSVGTDGSRKADTPATATKTGSVDSELPFTYPSDWQLVQTKEETYRSMGSDSQYKGETTQLTTVTSPSGDTVVTIQGGIGGIGGYCEPKEAGSFTDVNKTTLPDDGYKFVAYRDSQSYVGFGQMTTATASKAVAGGSVCETAFGQYLENYHRGIGRVTVTYKPFYVAEDKIYKASSTDFTKYVGSDEYAQAVAIVKSIGQER